MSKHYLDIDLTVPRTGAALFTELDRCLERMGLPSNIPIQFEGEIGEELRNVNARAFILVDKVTELNLLRYRS